MRHLDFVIPSVHLDQDGFWAKTLGGLGHRVHFIHEAVDYDPVWFDLTPLHPSVTYLRYQNYQALDEESLVIFVQCVEHEAQVYERLVASKPRARVVHVIGNNIQEPGRSPGRRPRNLIALDINAFAHWQAEGIENICYLQPGCDDEHYAYQPIDATRPPQVNCYIHGYFQNYQRGWELYTRIRRQLEDVAEFRLYGGGNPDGFLVSAEAEALPSVPRTANAGRQLDALRRSWLTIHIKEWEGYGFNVVKSLMVGRPVIAIKDFVLDKTIQYLCVDGVSAIMEPESHVDRLCARVRSYLARPQSPGRLRQAG